MKLNKILWLISFVVINMCCFSLYSQNIGIEDSPDSKIIRMGFSAELFSDVDIKDAEIAIEMWLNEVANQMSDYRTKSGIYRNFSSLLKVLTTKEVDIIGLTTLEYIKIKKQIYLEPAVNTSYTDRVTEEFILLVRKDKNINEFSQLKNKKITISKDIRGDVSCLWLNTLLLKNDLPECKDFFKIIRRVYKPSQIVLPVFFNQADACIVRQKSFNTIIELNPQVGKELKVLAKSPGLLLGIVCFQKYCNKEIREEFFKAANRIHKEPKGKQILTLIKKDKMIPFKPEYLESIKALVKEYNRLKN